MKIPRFTRDGNSQAQGGKSVEGPSKFDSRHPGSPVGGTLNASDGLCSLEQAVRLDCLELALRTRGESAEASGVVTDAGRYADFVLRGMAEPTDPPAMAGAQTAGDAPKAVREQFPDLPATADRRPIELVIDGGQAKRLVEIAAPVDPQGLARDCRVCLMRQDGTPDETYLTVTHESALTVAGLLLRGVEVPKNYLCPEGSDGRA